MAVDMDALLFQCEMGVIVAGGALFHCIERSRAIIKKNDRVEERLWVLTSKDALFPEDVFIFLC